MNRSDGAQRNSSFAWSKYASLASRLSSRKASPVRGRTLLGALDPIAEPPRHRAQRELRIDVEPPRDVHRGEEHVAELLEDVRVRLRLGRRLASGRVDRLLQLANLVVEVVERAAHVRVLEVDRRGAPLHLARVEERRQRLRHVVEDARAALLLALDRLPVRAHAAGRLGLDLAEDVRMPPHELLVNQPRDAFEVAAAALLEQQREEVDLEQQVAELVEQLRVVLRDRRVRDLVRLLDRVRHDRARRLLAIPRAVAPQPARQLLQVEQGVAEPARVAQAVSRWSSWRPWTSTPAQSPSGTRPCR